VSLVQPKSSAGSSSLPLFRTGPLSPQVVVLRSPHAKHKMVQDVSAIFAVLDTAALSCFPIRAAGLFAPPLMRNTLRRLCPTEPRATDPATVRAASLARSKSSRRPTRKVLPEHAPSRSTPRRGNIRPAVRPHAPFFSSASLVTPQSSPHAQRAGTRIKD